MLGQPKKIADQILEVISIMAKFFVQKEWPQLPAELLQQIQTSQDPNTVKMCFEVFKKICKKYRYLFRSDELYEEMNAMIQTLGTTILQQASVSFSS